MYSKPNLKCKSSCPSNLSRLKCVLKFLFGIYEIGYFESVIFSLFVFIVIINSINLVDGIVDEFHDESGTDEAEGSNDTYCATSDFYKNQLLY